MKLSDKKYAQYWDSIPEGEENAITYPGLIVKWGMSTRQARKVLQALSAYDNGDNFVLIRSSKRRGFYKTDDLDAIAAYRRECMSKGRSIMAAIGKCNRLLSVDRRQCDMFDALFWEGEETA